MSTDDDVRNHVAGATVRHASPFHDIEVPSSSELLPEAFRQKWVIPFYMASREELMANVRPVYDEINEGLVLQLLSQFDWRPRIIGAKFAAIKKLASLDDVIGKLLLRSDVCYAGHGYCLALARFDTAAASAHLTRYLDYYLGRVDLWFDQGSAMAALGHLDRQRGTRVRDRYLEAWTRFVENKPHWDLRRDDAVFEESFATVVAVESALSGDRVE
jgi:hypothetical protein